jgi:DNA processing protein
MVEERAFWLALSGIDGIGPISLRRLHKHFGSLEAAWQAYPADLLEVEGVGLQTADLIATARRQIQPEALLQQHEQANPTFWTPGDRDYPRLLLEAPDSPPMLYYRGVVDPQELSGATPTIAIVGTRNPSEYGKRWTRRITKALVDRGFTIVSGLAEGIDTEVHQSCLEAGGRTIAVLGCGTDVIYPWSNRGLYQKVLQTGLVVSEHAAGTQPDRMFFPRRNRVIAGLCRATLVMEAPEKSGGLITARYANEYGRDVYVLPGSLDNPKAIGCLNLVEQGAQLILGEDKLIEKLGMLPQLDRPAATSQPTILLNLPPDMQQILHAIAEAQSSHPEGVPLDWLVQKTGLPSGTVLGSLTTLEMQDLITTLPGMRYQSM